MYKFSSLLLFLGLLAVPIANAALLDNTLPPDYAVILSRQAPGTPQYECHSDCGNALAGGRDPAHCSNATWTGYYEACLDCALAFDIWRIYGTGVGSAASACGLSPTPSSPSSESSGAPASSSSSSSAVPTAESSAAVTTTPPTPTPSADSDAETTSVSTAGAASGPAAFAPGSVSSCVGVLVAGLAGWMGLL